MQPDAIEAAEDSEKDFHTAVYDAVRGEEEDEADRRDNAQKIEIGAVS